MNRIFEMLVASIGIFVGSLLSDVLFGDGLQLDDLQQAISLAILAGAIQWWLAGRK